MNQNKKGLNILICGSQKFSDESFVFSMMDQIYKAYNGCIDTIFTSKFSGSCEYVRKWIEYTNIAIKEFARVNNFSFEKHLIKSSDCTFDMLLSKENISLYEDVDIPDFIIQTDPFFQKGKELLIEKNINMILAFPNKEYILGPSTKNIYRFAKLANLENAFFDCSQIYKEILDIKNETIMEINKIQNNINNNNVFINKRPNKKF
jgi:hypothetical protein